MVAHRRQLRRRCRQLLNNPAISRRVIQNRMNPLENYSWDDIFDRLRVCPHTIHFIMDIIASTLAHNTTKNCYFPAVLQLLTCLRFLATGAFYRLVGDSIVVSETTTGRCCHAVSVKRPSFVVCNVIWSF